MFAGHFGLAAAIKSKRADVPLWALMLSTQLLDVIFVVLVLTGVESFTAGGYGEGTIHAYYTHSLVGALLIALVAGLLAGRWWGRSGALVIAATVFSHWILDLIVHRADLPILPGNLGNLPLLGFGLWQEPLISASVEGFLILIGGWLYFSSVLSRARSVTANPQRARAWAIASGTILCTLMALSLITDFTGIG